MLVTVDFIVLIGILVFDIVLTIILHFAKLVIIKQFGYRIWSTLNLMRPIVNDYINK
jgi:hypothetical protein